MSQDNIVIVIDPGHGGLGGGSDDGASYNGVMERYINIATAKAMYEELSKYENVKVYMTRDNPDQAMTLKQRAQFASEVGADYLISIHYNASEEHMIYGSEVWIPSIGKYYAEGYGIGQAVLAEFDEMGLYLKGVKTRVGDGDDEYYGIIRESEKLNITGLIIEHCYIDNTRDYAYYCNQEAYERFGRADATGVAKALGLKSTQLGIDYSMVQAKIKAPVSRVYQDETPPEVVIKSCSTDGNGIVNICLYAIDGESGISHYAYSLDDGVHFSELLPWYDRDGDHEEQITVMNVSGNLAGVVVKAYNNYNLVSTSNRVLLNGINGVFVDTHVQETIESTLTETVPYTLESTMAVSETIASTSAMETTSSSVAETVTERKEKNISQEGSQSSSETTLQEEMMPIMEGEETFHSEVKETGSLADENLRYHNRKTGAVVAGALFVPVVLVIFFKSVLAASVKKWYHKIKETIMNNVERMKNG